MIHTESCRCYHFGIIINFIYPVFFQLYYSDSPTHTYFILLCVWILYKDTNAHICIMLACPRFLHTHITLCLIHTHTHTHIISLCWTHIYTYTHIYYTTLFDSYTFDSHAYTHTYTYVHQSHWSVHTTYSYVSYYFVPYTHTHLDNTVYVIYIHTLTYWHIERHTKI